MIGRKKGEKQKREKKRAKNKKKHKVIHGTTPFVHGGMNWYEMVWLPPPPPPPLLSSHHFCFFLLPSQSWPLSVTISFLFSLSLSPSLFLSFARLWREHLFCIMFCMSPCFCLNHILLLISLFSTLNNSFINLFFLFIYRSMTHAMSVQYWKEKENKIL